MIERAAAAEMYLVSFLFLNNHFCYLFGRNTTDGGRQRPFRLKSQSVCGYKPAILTHVCGRNIVLLSSQLLIFQILGHLEEKSIFK